jgi:hypothetical protein
MSIEEMINSERVLNDLGIWQKEVIARVMQNYADQEAIAFGKWYSAMGEEKAKRAYNRFKDKTDNEQK